MLYFILEGLLVCWCVWGFEEVDFDGKLLMCFGKVGDVVVVVVVCD